jgi:hypothetical protein
MVMLQSIGSFDKFAFISQTTQRHIPEHDYQEAAL